MNLTDITFRPESTGKQAISSDLEYITNTVQRLFHMVRGADVYDNNMGLDIVKESRKPADSGTRNTEYESRIMEQFNTYTDISVRNVMAIYEDKTLKIYMNVSYQNQSYTLVTDSVSQQTQVLTTKR